MYHLIITSMYKRAIIFSIKYTQERNVENILFLATHDMLALLFMTYCYNPRKDNVEIVACTVSIQNLKLHTSFQKFIIFILLACP